LLIKYIKGVLWRVAKRLYYIEDGRCLKVKFTYSDWLMMTSEFERVWKEAIVTKFQALSRHFLRGTEENSEIRQ